MGVRIILFFLLIFTFLKSSAEPIFSDFFTEGSLRIDYIHAGDAQEEHFFIDEMIASPHWGGSKTNLIDRMNYGSYLFKVFDEKSNTLLYSRGYSTLFSEWRTTEEASLIQKSFLETIVMPFPKDKIVVVFFSRNFETGLFDEKYRFTVDPNSYFIKRDSRLAFPVVDIEQHGKSSEKVDIVILPEGYLADEMELFIADCQKFTEELFSFEPYKTYRNRFNLYAVLAPSAEAGADIPKEAIWKNTVLDCSYYTFDSESYLMTTDSKSVRDLAANAPYDQIYILVNSSKYGGGGIFNDYCTAVNKHTAAAKVRVHEFGHGFAGLADEYEGDVSYNNMYNLKLEPYEPNITTLVDFEAKWKNMLAKNTPIPTPNEPQYKEQVGVFEGAGYATKNIYRPMQDCLMRTFDGDTFCPVCQKAITEMILFYTQPVETN